MKKFVSLLILAVLMTAVCVPAMAISIRGISSGDTLYVKTTGGNLNAREKADAKAKITYKLPNNCPVTALDEYADNYLLVEFKYNGKFATGYVCLDYLTDVKPSKVNNNGATKVGGDTPKPDPKPETAELVKDLDFSSYKLVEEGWEKIIAAKPARSGGFVNLRWAPSTDASRIAKMYKGMEMKVIAEGKKWYQVEISDGHVGFISKEFTYVVSYMPIDVGTPAAQ